MLTLSTAIKFNLDVSLFERLVRNGVEHVTLTHQRRMRPEIAALVQHIYPQLQNHSYVCGYGGVAGLASPLFFLDHSSPDANEPGQSSSKINVFEVGFACALAAYLVLW
jgi:hypothetical protein